MKHRRTSATFRRGLLCLGACPALLAAQVQQGNSTPIDQVLLLAQQAYDDLNYPRADSVARSVLALNTVITPRQKTQALMIIAAAAFPEEEEMRKPTLARGTLRELVRTNVELNFPTTLTWPGLDSLVEEVKRTTFGMEVQGDSIQTMVGPSGRALLRVRSTLPGRFFYSIVAGPDDSVLVLDSLPTGTSGELQLPTMRGNRPAFASGTYTVMVTGVDSATRELLTLRYPVRIESAPLEFIRIPATIDSTNLFPVRAGRFGYKSVIAGLFAGAGAYALSTQLRPQDGEIRNNVAVDSRGMAIGGGIALLAIVGGYFDPGRRIPENIEANEKYVAAFAKAVEDARAENERRTQAHSTTMRFTLEAR